MGGAGFVVVLVAFVAVVAFFGYRSYQQEKARRAALFQYAVGRGWGFTVEDDSVCRQWNGPPFNEGDHRRATNVIRGVDRGRSFEAFDYSFQTHSSNGKGGETTTTHHYSICAITLPTYLPNLSVTPENILTRIGHAMGFDDIELESDAFNRKFRVTCRERKFATDVLCPRTMELLLAHPGCAMRIEGASLVGWQQGEQSIVGIQQSLSTLGGVIDGIPSFVWADNGVPQPAPTPEASS